MTLENTTYLWEEWCFQTGYLPHRHTALKQSRSHSVLHSHFSFCVCVEQSVLQRQPEQILNILSYKLFTVNTNTTTCENTWSMKVHLTLSLLCTQLPPTKLSICHTQFSTRSVGKKKKKKEPKSHQILLVH